MRQTGKTHRREHCASARSWKTARLVHSTLMVIRFEREVRSLSVEIDPAIRAAKVPDCSAPKRFRVPGEMVLDLEVLCSSVDLAMMPMLDRRSFQLCLLGPVRVVGLAVPLDPSQHLVAKGEMRFVAVSAAARPESRPGGVESASQRSSRPV